MEEVRQVMGHLGKTGVSRFRAEPGWRTICAMDEINSGTKARDGQLGGMDVEIDSAGVGVFGSSDGRCLLLHPEQLHHLRQRRDALVFRPGRYLFHRKLQHLRQMGISGKAQSGAQRALAHPVIDLRRNDLPLGLDRHRAKHRRQQLEPANRAPGCKINLDCSLRLDGGCALLPLGDEALGGGRTRCRQQSGERRLRQTLFFSVGGDVHRSSMSAPDIEVNSAAIGK